MDLAETVEVVTLVARSWPLSLSRRLKLISKKLQELLSLTLLQDQLHHSLLKLHLLKEQHQHV